MGSNNNCGSFLKFGGKFLRLSACYSSQKTVQARPAVPQVIKPHFTANKHLSLPRFHPGIKLEVNKSNGGITNEYLKSRVYNDNYLETESNKYLEQIKARYGINCFGERLSLIDCGICGGLSKEWIKDTSSLKNTIGINDETACSTDKATINHAAINQSKMYTPHRLMLWALPFKSQKTIGQLQQYLIGDGIEDIFNTNVNKRVKNKPDYAEYARLAKETLELIKSNKENNDPTSTGYGLLSFCGKIPLHWTAYEHAAGQDGYKFFDPLFGEFHCKNDREAMKVLRGLLTSYRTRTIANSRVKVAESVEGKACTDF